jgi:hypothetical protein
MKFNGQILQDKFVLCMLNYKYNGYFVEIGSNDPIIINNTYNLETFFNWQGIMIEYDNKWLQSYQNIRKNSIHIINDATKIDYKTLFESYNVPLNVDYLQIDLEENDGSTLKTLQKLNEEILHKYKFATVTFEHDIYNAYSPETREKSREIFLNRGYYTVLNDISNENNPYEDWYVHPDLVDMNIIRKFQDKNLNKYRHHPISGTTIDATNIDYD